MPQRAGSEVAELIPAQSRAHFVPRSVIEGIIREAPLDRHFSDDIETAAGQRVQIRRV